MIPSIPRPRAPLARIQGRDVVVTTDEAAIEDARITLRDAWFVRLPGFLDAAALAWARSQLETASLVEKPQPGIGVDAHVEPDLLFGRLELHLNDRKLTALAARVAGVPHVGSFEGRIYRMVPGAGHHEGYHDDVTGGRCLALTLNLSRDRYEGGMLEMRRKDSDEVVAIPNVTPGDAVLFRIDPELEHRVTPLEGDMAKTALAGWYCTTPDFDARLLRRLRPPTRDGQPPG